jgi:membrane protein YqaA with SNARE-associated domain
MMQRVLAWVEAFALSIGGPGLFLIAFLDSSFLSLPEINDILVIWMVTRHKERMIYYALMATLGSVAGCLTLYVLGRKGGEALLHRRFRAGQIERGLDLFRRYGILAVLIPAILPPPAPFKIFVLLAGVARVNLLHFAWAIAVGRGFRYFGEGLLAYYYGEQALQLLHENGRTVSLVLVTLVVLSTLAFFIVRARRTAPAPDELK